MRVCSIEGCDRVVLARGMCRRHYENQRNYGHAIPRKEWPLIERLRSVGWDVTPAGCWEWRGAKNEHGYARYGKNLRVSRLIYREMVGQFDDDLEILHRCDNPPCVNPDHLRPDTHAANMADMAAKGRHWMNEWTHCPNGHPYGDDRPTASSNNRCKECARERNRRYRERKRAA
jgi:hypothetical protein